MRDKNTIIRWFLSIFFSYASTYEVIFEGTSGLRILGMSYFFISLFLYFFISKHLMRLSYFITNTFVKNKLVKEKQEKLLTAFLLPSIILLLGSIALFTASKYFIYLSKSGEINTIRFFFIIPKLNIAIILITLIIAFVIGVVRLIVNLRKQLGNEQAIFASFIFNLTLYSNFILLSYILSRIFHYITDLLVVATAFGFGVA